jgi:hypothetical protein
MILYSKLFFFSLSSWKNWKLRSQNYFFFPHTEVLESSDEKRDHEDKEEIGNLNNVIVVLPFQRTVGTNLLQRITK